MKENDRITGTYSKLPFSGTVYHIDNNGFIFVNVDLPYHRDLPVGKPISSHGKPANRCDLNLLCSFRPTDANIVITSHVASGALRPLRRQIIEGVLRSYPYGTNIRILITRVQIRELLDYGFELKSVTK